MESADELVTGSEGLCRSGKYGLSIVRLENVIVVGEVFLEETRAALSRVKAAEIIAPFR